MDVSPVWDEGPAPRFSPLTGTHAADVCVVGLGGSGLTAIREALRFGARVVGLDAGSVGGGAAGRNGGFLLAGLPRFHHVAAAQLGGTRAAGLYRATLDEITRMAGETPDEVRLVGSIRLATTPDEEADCQAQHLAMQRDGLPVEPYDGPDGRGLRFPRDGSLQPLARCRRLAATATREGAELAEHSPAVAIATGEVRTPDAVVRCSRVVVAVDGGLEAVLPELAGRVRTARAQMLATAPTDEVDIACPVYARYGYDYWQQVAGRIVLGGFRDRGGPAEWTTDAAPTAPVQRLLDEHLRGKLEVTAPVTHRWAGLIAFTGDRMPIFEEVRRGVLALGAYSGTGNALGALYGRAAAAWACGADSSALGVVASP